MAPVFRDPPAFLSNQTIYFHSLACLSEPCVMSSNAPTACLVFSLLSQFSIHACIVHCVAGDLEGMMYMQSMDVILQSALKVI